MSLKQSIAFLFTAILIFSTALIFSIAEKSIELYTYLFIIASALYLICIQMINKYNIGKRLLYTSVLVFYISKMLFIGTEPVGSDDYYRYIWDGKVQADGINPYQYAPNDSTLNHLHSELLTEKVSYQHIKTIYFPLSQWLFTLSYWSSGENTIGLKILYLLFELFIFLTLLYLLKKLYLETKYILIYAASPLVTFQFFLDAHIDIVGAALMLSSIALYFYDKKILSYILLGFSLSVKPTGLLLIPLYFQNEISIKEKLNSAVIPAVVFIVTFLPYIFTATPVDTLVNYSVHWAFNGMIYNAINVFINDNQTTRSICGISFLLVYGYVLISKNRLIHKIYLSLFLIMIFSPVVHPWYLIWFAVLLPIVRNYSGIYFVSAISLTYFIVISFQKSGVWKESPYILLIEYVPLLILFIGEIVKQKNLTVT